MRTLEQIRSEYQALRKRMAAGNMSEANRMHHRNLMRQLEGEYDAIQQFQAVPAKKFDNVDVNKLNAIVGEYERVVNALRYTPMSEANRNVHRDKLRVLEAEFDREYDKLQR